MADKSPIEWTDSTWNPIGGCTRVSEGCRNCYAEIMAALFSDPGQWGHGLAQRVTLPDGTTDHRWTGKLVLNEHRLDQPLRWRKPRMIFVNSTSDLFHEAVPDEWIDRVFAVMALAPHHTFQVLTKRPERAREYLNSAEKAYGQLVFWTYRFKDAALKAGAYLGDLQYLRTCTWPLPNVWLGTSVDDEATADARIRHLLNTPAAVRFISAEPLLGALDLQALGSGANAVDALTGYLGWGMYGDYGHRLDWVICGGESGKGARPMHPDWARSLRDQCKDAGVPFFFKQWGEWHPGDGFGEELDGKAFGCFNDAGQWVHPVDQEWANAGRQMMFRLGKHATGNLLDGQVWQQMPEVQND